MFSVKKTNIKVIFLFNDHNPHHAEINMSTFFLFKK